MVAALVNLKTSAVQKNDTVKRLVISNASLYASLVARDPKISRLCTVITNLSTGGGSGGGGGSGTKNKKNTKPPSDPTQATSGRAVTISVSATAVPRVLNAKTEKMPTLK